MPGRRGVLAGIAAMLAGVVVLGLPIPVSAHALRIASSPGADAVLAAAPAQVSITFGERPDPGVSTIQVLDSSGTDQVSGRAQPSAADDRTLVVPVKQLPNGVYTVAWRTLSAVDGHRAAGSFAFGVGVDATAIASADTAGGGSSVTDTSPPPSIPAVAGRWLLYAGLIAVLGAGLVGGLVVGSISRPVLVQALAGAAAATAGTALMVSAQARDSGLGFGDLLRSSLGPATMERVVTVALMLLPLGLATLMRAQRRRPLLLVAAALSALAMLADAGNGHAAAATAWEPATVLLQWIHIVAVGFWVGGLAALLLALRGGPTEARAGAVRRFSTGAGIALLAVLVTGVVRAAVEIGSWGRVLSTTFGLIVLVKVVLVGILAVLGAVNRRRNVPRAATTLRGLRRVGALELAVATGAVLAASLLVNVAPPASAQAGGTTAPAAVQPLTLTASDYATTITVRLSVSPGAAGFNTFSAQVAGYDSGTTAPGVSGVQLSFSLIERPDIGASTLRLSRSGDGNWSGRGANLSIDGVWSVTMLVERGAGSEQVVFTLPTRTTQKIDVSAVQGQPTLYTVHLAAGRSVQWYLDPQVPGRAAVHATFFDASGNGYPVTSGVMTVLPAGGAISTLPTQQLEPGHFVGDVVLARGASRFDVVATGPGGGPVSAHIDVTVGS